LLYQPTALERHPADFRNEAFRDLSGLNRCNNPLSASAYKIMVFPVLRHAFFNSYIGVYKFCVFAKEFLHWFDFWELLLTDKFSSRPSPACRESQDPSSCVFPPLFLRYDRTLKSIHQYKQGQPASWSLLIVKEWHDVPHL